MTKMNQAIDINAEYYIQRWKHGIRLVKTDQKHSSSKQSFSHIMNLPFNIYFMDTNSILKNINEQVAKTCGYYSIKDAIGRSIRDVSKKETARFIIKNDREIIRTEKLKVIEEEYTRLDDFDLTAISIKFPWYHHDKVIGVFGCSLLIGYSDVIPLTDYLSLLIQTGLLAPSQSSIKAILPGLQFDNTYLNQREANILSFLIRGKTAKGIANILGLSHRTIEHQLEKIKIKMKVSSKSELIEKVIHYCK